MSYYNWPEIMANKSSLELAQIVRERRSEPEVKISAALNELNNRGIEGSCYSEIIKTIKDSEPKPDENSPIIYSKKAICLFTGLFSLIAGGILFAVNLKDTDRKRGIYPVIAVSIIYTAAMVYFTFLIDGLIDGGSTIGGLVHITGALIISSVFWNKYLGKDFLYHKKNVIKPAIIALVVSSLCIPAKLDTHSD